MQTPAHELDELVASLSDARQTAAARGHAQVSGVRAVASRPGTRHFMCAFVDGRIGCLDGDLAPVDDRTQVREVLRVAMLMEHVQELIDAASLQVLLAEATTVRQIVDDAPVRRAADAIVDAAGALIAWRQDPGLAVAQMSALDAAVGLHDTVRRAWIAFIAATDPLVPIQDTLPDAVRDALRRLEQACGDAGVVGQLAPLVAGALPGIDTGVDELMDRYWSVPGPTA